MTRPAATTGVGPVRPAFYARGTGSGGLRDWVSLLHPPYTVWHLSYVAIGAALAPTFTLWRLLGTLAAFFLAVGVGAHALDEMAGNPLRTGISRRRLTAAAVVGLVTPVVVGALYGGWRLLPFIATGVMLALGYNLELAHGLLHNGLGFALGWGAFPVVTGCYAQDFRISGGALLAAAAAVLLSMGQRTLSVQARALRRTTSTIEGRLVETNGHVTPLDRDALLAPLENTLRFVAGGVACIAAALVLSR